MQRCSTCGRNAVLIERFDAYACFSCDDWLEKACSDPQCEFCNHRPDRPSQV